MNILRWIKYFSNSLKVTKNHINYSTNGKNCEIFENEKSLDKFQELKINRVIYKKDYNDYMRLYKLYKPNYTKLIIEKENLKFSIYWYFNNKTISVNSKISKKKKKMFTDMLHILEQELNQLNFNINKRIKGIKKIIEKTEEENKKNKIIKIKDESNSNIVKRDEENPFNIKINSEVKNEYDESVIKKLKNKNLINSTSKNKYVLDLNTTNIEIERKSTIKKDKEKNENKINYVKLLKIWESFLFYKEKNNFKEEKIYLEILKNLFLKANFFEKNKKKDFEFFESILNSLLLKPEIFINVLNVLYSFFFDSLYIHKNSKKTKQINNFISKNINIKDSNINYHNNLENENIFIRKNNESIKTHLVKDSYEKCEEKNEKYISEDKIINDKLISIREVKSEDRHKNNSSDLICIKIRRYILSYLFNTYYEKYIGLKSLHKTFDLHNSYNLKFCSKENNLYKFVSLEEIDFEKNNIILIRYNKEKVFLLGIIKKIHKIKDFYVLYLDLKKYNSYKCENNNIRLYEEMDISDEYFECYLNIKNKCNKSNLNISINDNESTYIKESFYNTNESKIYEAVTLSVQLNTIYNRIKHSMLDIFEKKEFLNNEIIRMLLNEDDQTNKEELKLNNLDKILNNSVNYNYLIEESIKNYILNNKKEGNYINILDKDLIKKDKIINKLYKSLKNNIEEFTKMCYIYKKFDIYQKSVLYDILINEKKKPIHLVHGAPGSGKSDLISFIIYFLTLEKKNNVFVGTNKHISVHNIRNKLLNLNLCLNRDNINKRVYQKSDIYIDTIYQAFKIKEKKIKHLIIDEASSLSEYNSLICLNLNCDFIYAFGDDKQLTFHSLINEKKRLEINYLSIFEKLKKHNNIKCHYLLIQYRLIFPMFLFTSFYFYNRKLIPSKNILNNFFKPNINKTNFFHILSNHSSFNLKNKLFENVYIPILFIDTYHETLNKNTFEEKVNCSYINHFEAEVILKLTKILNIYNQKNVAILTPYTSQKVYIQNVLENKYKNNSTFDNKINQKGNNEEPKNKIYEKIFRSSWKKLQNDNIFSVEDNIPSHDNHCNNNLNFLKKCNNKILNNHLDYCLINKDVKLNPDVHNKSLLTSNKTFNSYFENNKIKNEKYLHDCERKYYINHEDSKNSSYTFRFNNLSKTNELNSLFKIKNIGIPIYNANNNKENCNFLYKSVHTIDSYQGCENDLIIISTVRSNDKNILGFLTDEKRMNVLLTRMKKGIIIIGNSNTLKNNFYWKEFIYFLDFFNSRKSIFAFPLLNIFK
ncbi:conserved Plasmodium protein, unknown function [Plasmodium gallinaceum]|uniref:DNA2/NAM7 helicase-like C-terminal domain-containing protein n=1 Tax=Plasmodium gallinaceum TaxID=5849 RepID=A0A1J1GS08_PLAGA|nr:conserved Plasmodium protein, unknown function [Plasmodium gallinaceum]CRG95062.1 conserved Plasmodium protein, unknown function [Plasmodium gallinaceum]